MENEELKPSDATEQDADSYYGEDDAGGEDLDLSFLDEEDDDEDEAGSKPA
jgi:hypothetical protein